MLLRSVLQKKPELRRCLIRCKHCRIFLLTSHSNHDREDIRCPFGCREAHRKRESTRRSVEFYRGKNGKKLKSIQNQKRKKQSPKKDTDQPAPDPGGSDPVADQSVADPGGSDPVADQPAADPRASDPVVGQSQWAGALVEHIRVASSLIEGRRVSLSEIQRMLAEDLRQHTLGRGSRIDHIVWWLNANPP